MFCCCYCCFAIDVIVIVVVVVCYGCFAVDIDNADVDLTPYIKPAISFIKHVESIGGRVLVHCIAGKTLYCSYSCYRLIFAHLTTIYFPILCLCYAIYYNILYTIYLSTTRFFHGLEVTSDIISIC